MPIDSPFNNDNREYDYSQFPDQERSEYVTIIDLVPPNSTVLDLGCGNGALLSRLHTIKNVAGTGMDISKSGVAICRQRGLSAQVGQIDRTLPFRDNEFDYAICNVTIQMVMYPEVLLREMKRVARFQIVSFPNFAFWRNRIDLLFNGRMPKRMLFEYSWYSTGHIHQLSFVDFKELIDHVGGLQIVEQRLEQSDHPVKDILMRKFPNLFQMLGVFVLVKK